MTVIRVLNKISKEEKLAIEGDFRLSDVQEAMDELREKYHEHYTVEDLVNLLEEKGYGFKQVWIHTFEL